jgi:hypothetical protein
MANETAKAMSAARVKARENMRIITAPLKKDLLLREHVTGCRDMRDSANYQVRTQALYQANIISAPLDSPHTS